MSPPPCGRARARGPRPPPRALPRCTSAAVVAPRLHRGPLSPLPDGGSICLAPSTPFPAAFGPRAGVSEDDDAEADVALEQARHGPLLRRKLQMQVTRARRCFHPRGAVPTEAGEDSHSHICQSASRGASAMQQPYDTTIHCRSRGGPRGSRLSFSLTFFYAKRQIPHF